MSRVVVENQSARCGVCGTLAAIKSLRYELNGSILINAVHGIGRGIRTVEHSWHTIEPDKYLVVASEAKTKTKIKTKRNPQYITCPKCGKKGRLTEFHPRIKQRPDKTRFYVKHEYIGGRWGTGKYPIKRFRRCYFNKS